MTKSYENLLPQAQEYVAQFYADHFPENLVFHDFHHTRQVAEAALELGAEAGVGEEGLLALQLAAWFHDLGYYQQPEGHEERSAALAEAFLQEQGAPLEIIETVKGCILATRLPQSPRTELQAILCDADLSHLGNEHYWDRCGRLRQEMNIAREVVMSDPEWVEFEIGFLMNHRYHTEAARERFNKGKHKHIKQLHKQKLRLNPNAMEALPETAPPPKNKKKKKKTGKAGDQLKELNLGRGVETMYRTTYRTHVNLSSIADNKANIMLSINAIIISIVVSSLVPQFSTNPRLIFPTILLLIVCLSALVFAILATRPKVTEGKVTRADINNKQANLLFFGNFYNMNLDDFHWGMMEMIKDSDFLYSAMTRDLYYLGVVLGKKYRYLRICYGIFMYGLIVSVAVFAYVFATAAT
ncbi:Pycsar system effector family protein [Phaeodactylibacter luteus]|uniref:HD domain-containing protein n=1 Tax=Phaeodactylibacter luteus TaxID=1564516 RepID=A0A5C6RI38_9BACT|nr:Pycsar system effector family protein [Phaeodactylibacter luteus]TXB61783.1 HD domain-containing protein [Phaeodactylibacter luteus]